MKYIWYSFQKVNILYVFSKISRVALFYILKGLGFGLSAVKPLEQAKILPELVIPTEPPPEFEFIADPPSISSFDL